MKELGRVPAAAMVCPCHGEPAMREYRPDGRGRRYLDACARDGFNLGWDGAVRRSDWERAQRRKAAAREEAEDGDSL